MRRYLVLVLLMFLAAGCKKEKDPAVAGTVTIDNSLYGEGPYYAMGFSFPGAKKVSTLDKPPPDITLIAVTDLYGSILKLNLQTTNFKGSFYKAGQYASASDAKLAYDNLNSATVSQWSDDADAIEAGQIWIFRTATEKYAKFRITATFSEERDVWPYAECTFEWAYQPDGTLTFP